MMVDLGVPPSCCLPDLRGVREFGLTTRVSWTAVLVVKVSALRPKGLGQWTHRLPILREDWEITTTAKVSTVAMARLGHTTQPA